MSAHSRTIYSGAAALLALTFAFSPSRMTAAPLDQTSAGFATAHLQGRLSGGTTIPLAFTLPLRNEEQLDALLKRLYDPHDSLYGHFLTPQQFTAQFGPTEQDYRTIVAYARSRGFTVTHTCSNRLVLDVAAPASKVEAAFGMRLLRYRDAGSHSFFAPDSQANIPAVIAGKLSAIVGLNNARVLQPQLKAFSRTDPSLVPPLQIGSGPLNGLTPSDIKTAYSLGSLTATGAGQTLGLFELDGYNPADVQAYETQFGLPSVPLQNVLIDGVNGQAGGNADEVTLDIELMAALARNASKIMVYEGPNSSFGLVDTFNQMAIDNQAKEISVSWGSSEQFGDGVEHGGENSIFKQMAAQGQTVYAASGDRGAENWGNGPTVYDPASQPFVVSVGGTTLVTNGPGGAWQSEGTWNNGNGNATGGGISSLWEIPSWQQGAGSAAALTSTTNRNVPDVALDADPYSGYSIYYNGAWNIYGGTSCAAPLWAAFTALVNQQRAAGSLPPIGFAAPAIYQIAEGARYANDFHDIADGLNNLVYPSVAGYDDATGWGSFNGANLFADLVGAAAYTQATTTVTLPAAADSYVQDGGASKQNFGTQTTLLVKNAGSANNYDRIAYLKFSLAALPANITSAKLRLYGAYNAAGYSGAASCKSVASSTWTETGITWNNKPATGAALSSATVTSTPQYVQWDVTSFVQSQKTAGQSQVSLAITMNAAAANYDYFNSRENAVNKPQLVVTTAAAPAAPLSLQATPHNNQIVLNWVSPAAATGFNIYRAVGSAGPYSLQNSGPLMGSPYTDNSVVNGTTYYYYVVAVNSIGSSSPSNIASETPSLEGGNPVSRFVQVNNLLYGTTYNCGANDEGSILQMNLSGNVTVLHSIVYTDGANPWAALTLGSDGNFYGTCQNSGPTGQLGTVFRMDPTDSVTVLHEFENFTSGNDNTSGAFPSCQMTQGYDGALYGTSINGGANGQGTAYRIGLDGAFTKLHDFVNATEGNQPYGGVITGPNGNYYGSCYYGGPGGVGTVYSMTPSGVVTILHAFNGTDGGYPRGRLLLASDGYLYGECAGAGTNGTGTLFRIAPDGTGFTVLHTCGAMDSQYRSSDLVEPEGGLIQGSDGSFYGSSLYGGTNGTGVVFKMDITGNVTILHNFGAYVNNGSNTDGAYAWGGLMQASDSNLYGMTYRGGRYNFGIAYRCSTSGVFTPLHISFHN